VTELKGEWRGKSSRRLTKEKTPSHLTVKESCDSRPSHTVCDLSPEEFLIPTLIRADKGLPVTSSGRGREQFDLHFCLPTR
jgi:hypothetical protein